MKDPAPVQLPEDLGDSWLQVHFPGSVLYQDPIPESAIEVPYDAFCLLSDPGHSRFFLDEIDESEEECHIGGGVVRNQIDTERGVQVENPVNLRRGNLLPVKSRQDVNQLLVWNLAITARG